MSLLTNILGVLAGNSAAAHEIAIRRPYKQAIFLYALLAAVIGSVFVLSSYIQFKVLTSSDALAGLAINETVKAAIQQESFGSALAGNYWSLLIGLFLILLWIGCVLLLFFIELGLGGQASLGSFFCFSAYLSPILWLFAGAGLLSPLAALMSSGILIIIMSLFYLVLLIWLIRSLMIGSAAVHRISTGRAAAAVFLTILIWIIIGLLAWLASPLGGA